MSPNQPKTPVSGFRLDDETKARLRRISEQMGTTMTGALKRLAEDAEGSALAIKTLHEKVAPEPAPIVRFVRDRLLEEEGDMAIRGAYAGELASQQTFHPYLKAMWDVAEAVSDAAWATYAVRDVVLERFAAIWKGHPDYDEAWRA